MQRARLPIDVCERVIDSFNSCPRFFPPPGYFVDLCACALTCRDWVPRSRRNLYSSIQLRNARQLDALLNTIASLPFLADFVQELVIHPSEKYLPFAQENLASALRGVHRVHICYYDWAAHHPRYHQLVARYPIVELSLLGGTYRTMADLFRVIWAFEHLQALTLAIIEPFQQPSIPVDEIIHRRVRICLNLKTVIILGPVLLGTKVFPPVGCFGKALTSLCLIWTQEFGMTPPDALLLYLSAPSALRHLTWRADCGDIWKEEDIRACTAYVGSALHSIPADRPLRWVTLDFRAPVATGDMSRTAFLDCVLGKDLRTAVKPRKRFWAVTLLVPECDQVRFGPGWWMGKVDSWWIFHGVDVRTAPASMVWADEVFAPRIFLKKRPEDEYFGETAHMPLLLSELFKQR